MRWLWLSVLVCAGCVDAEEVPEGEDSDAASDFGSPGGWDAASGGGTWDSDVRGSGARDGEANGDASVSDADERGGARDGGPSRVDAAEADAAGQRPVDAGCVAACDRIAACLGDLPACLSPLPRFDGACVDACPAVEPDAACDDALAVAEAAMGEIIEWCERRDCVAERCNGVDDDCDGTVDEDDAALGGACGVGEGECAREGRVVCAGGMLTCDAPPAQPRSEACNGLDDDCDGALDEAFPTLGRPCDVGTGACRRSGRITCGRDGGAVCDAAAGAPSRELCNGEDDDCDGRVDEGFPVGQGCDEGLGVCLRPGRMRCDGVAAVCDARPGPPRAEVCDGVDGDCDGRVDEGNPSRIVIRNDWVTVPLYSAACNLVLNQVPVMYVSVDCRLDDPGCERAAINGPGAALYEGPPGRHFVHARCCQIDGTQCFGQNRRCSLPGSNEVYWCSCLEGEFDVNVAQCGEVEFAACSQ